MDGIFRMKRNLEGLSIRKLLSERPQRVAATGDHLSGCFSFSKAFAADFACRCPLSSRLGTHASRVVQDLYAIMRIF